MGSDRNSPACHARHATLWLNRNPPLITELQDRRTLLGAARIRERQDVCLRIARNPEVLCVPLNILHVGLNNNIRPDPLR